MQCVSERVKVANKLYLRHFGSQLSLMFTPLNKGFKFF